MIWPLLVSAAIAAVVAPGALRAFREAGWVRPNWRGEELPFPAGAVAVVAGVLALGVLAGVERVFEVQLLRLEVGGLALFGVLDRQEFDETLRVASYEPLMFTILFAGVAFLGLLDDLFDAAPRGWRGHAAAVLRGGFSTGALKAVGTLALALVALAPFGGSTGEYLLAVGVVVLATNFFNLLDLRPGRSAKAFVLLGAGLLIGSGETEPLRVLGAFAGPLIVLGLYDLRERAMLGDTGSNVLGAMAGVWLVLVLDTTGQAVAAGILVALTVFGEFRSLTQTIERIPPLRALDALGRRRQRPA